MRDITADRRFPPTVLGCRSATARHARHASAWSMSEIITTVLARKIIEAGERSPLRPVDLDYLHEVVDALPVLRGVDPAPEPDAHVVGCRCTRCRRL